LISKALSEPKRLVCVHGHFYQPPREDPFFEEVFAQPSASPEHDWNERVYKESYLPNSASRVLDQEGRIRSIWNNYSCMSFNFGPTLVGWLKRRHPRFLGYLREADRKALARWGSGCAIAQAHSHLILPLSSDLDLEVQVRWGKSSFKGVFGRNPAGMWLPETAVDLRTLRCLRRNGIQFTILGSHQCSAVSRGGERWAKVDEGSVDPFRPYRVSLGGDEWIWVFFFHRALSGELAFGGLLRSGDLMFQRFKGELEKVSAGRKEGDPPPCLLLACDGETFGHHHKFGEMALSRFFELVEEEGGMALALPEAVISLHANSWWEARVKENTSWSCAHGVERWRSDCGCSTGGEPNWHQRWRGPLREAVEFLRDRADEVFFSMGEKLLFDPLEALLEYVKVFEGMEDRGVFAATHFRDQNRALDCWKLLELQRMKLYSQTSCGWFFSDVSGLETVQILSYAARAFSLLRDFSDDDLEGRFVEILERAEGNKPSLRNGRLVYEKLVLPGMSGLSKALGIASVISRTRGEEFELGAIGCRCEALALPSLEGGGVRLGVVSARDSRTEEESSAFFVELNPAELKHFCFVFPRPEPERRRLLKEVLAVSTRSSQEEMKAFLRSLKPSLLLGLEDLPGDYRREVIEAELGKLREELHRLAARLYSDKKELLTNLSHLGIEPPPMLKVAAETFFAFYLSEAMRQLEGSDLSVAYLESLVPVLVEAKNSGASLELRALGKRVEDLVERTLEDFLLRGDESHLRDLAELMSLVKRLGLDLDLWRLQNRFFDLLRASPKLSKVELFREILEGLGFSRVIWESL